MQYHQFTSVLGPSYITIHYNRLFDLALTGFILDAWELDDVTVWIYIASEVANYVYLLLILGLLTHFKVLDSSYLIFWAIYLSSPLFINYILFPPYYIGDQYHYLRGVNEALAHGLAIFPKDMDFQALLFNKTATSSYLLSFVPMFSYLSVTSIAFINKLIALFLFIYLSRRINPKQLLFFFLIPSFLLYSSVGLKDGLIMAISTVAIIGVIERKYLISLIFIGITGLFKMQTIPGLAVLWLLAFIFRADLSKNISFLAGALGVVILIFTFDIYGENLNLFRLAFAVENCPGGYSFCDYTTLPRDIKLRSGIELLWVSFKTTPVFMFRPLPWEIASPFHLLASIEAVAMMYFLYVFTVKKNLYMNNTFWIIMLGFILTMVVNAVTSANIGTLTRYRFVSFWPYLVGFYYLVTMYGFTKQDKTA